MLLLGLCSCHDEPGMFNYFPKEYFQKGIFDKYNAYESYEGQFKAFWEGMDCNYPIWDYEEKFGLNWDAVYAKYLPKFQELDQRKNTVTNKEVDSLWKEIVSPLHDGHYNLGIHHLLTDNTWSQIIPAEIENSKRKDFKTTSPTFESIRKTDNAEWGKVLSVWRDHFYIRFKGNICYFRVGSKFIWKCLDENSDSYNNEYSKELRETWQEWIKEIKEFHDNNTLGGIIIDVRNLDGGANKDYQYIIGLFQPLDEKHPQYHSTGYLRYKNGPRRFDYAPLQDDQLPQTITEHIDVEEPIVVLANCQSKSTAEHICLGAKQMSNARVIGKKTWGAFSPILELKGSMIGQIGLPNDKDNPLHVYMPGAAFVTKDGEIIEGKGVEPDIEVELDEDLLKLYNRDSQLERALQYIRTGE